MREYGSNPYIIPYPVLVIEHNKLLEAQNCFRPSFQCILNVIHADNSIQMVLKLKKKQLDYSKFPTLFMYDFNYILVMLQKLHDSLEETFFVQGTRWPQGLAMALLIMNSSWF